MEPVTCTDLEKSSVQGFDWLAAGLDLTSLSAAQDGEVNTNPIISSSNLANPGADLVTDTFDPSDLFAATPGHTSGSVEDTALPEVKKERPTSWPFSPPGQRSVNPLSELSEPAPENTLDTVSQGRDTEMPMPSATKSCEFKATETSLSDIQKATKSDTVGTDCRSPTLRTYSSQANLAAPMSSTAINSTMQARDSSVASKGITSSDKSSFPLRKKVEDIIRSLKEEMKNFPPATMRTEAPTDTDQTTENSENERLQNLLDDMREAVEKTTQFCVELVNISSLALCYCGPHEQLGEIVPQNEMPLKHQLELLCSKIETFYLEASPALIDYAM